MENKLEKTPEERFLIRWQKAKSVEKQIYGFIKPRKCWEEGISFEKLKEKVEVSLKKNFCDGTIYSAISSLNRYGKEVSIYIRSDSNWTTDVNNQRKREHRYFVPTENEDISREHRDLEVKKGLINLKTNNLVFHERVTIPQELKLAQIQR